MEITDELKHKYNIKSADKSNHDVNTNQQSENRKEFVQTLSNQKHNSPVEGCNDNNNNVPQANTETDQIREQLRQQPSSNEGQDKEREQKQKEDRQRQADINTLINIHQILTSGVIEKSDDDILKAIGDIGSHFDKITWNEDALNSIRNYHGYRNRHKNAKNCVNSKGAKLPFETLAKLTNLANDPQHSKLLLSRTDLLNNSLEVLKQKVQYILAYYFDEIPEDLKEKVHHHIACQIRNESQNDTIGFLFTMAAYHHDRNCLSKLYQLTEEFCKNNYHTLDLSDFTNRFQLGYFFTQFGEMAKEISDYIKVDDSKSGEKNLTRFLFGRVAKLRDVIKTHYWNLFEIKSDSLPNMVTRFACVVQQLNNVLANLMKLTDFDNGSAEHIDKAYPAVNQCEMKDSPSAFEKNNIKDIEFIIYFLDTNSLEKSMDDQLTHLKKHLSTLDKIVSDSKDQKSAKELELLNFKSSDSKTHSQVTHDDAELKDLFKSMLESNGVKKFVNICSACDKDLLATYFSGDELALCQMVQSLQPTTTRFTSSNPPPEDFRTKSISKYKETVDKAVLRYEGKDGQRKINRKPNPYTNLIQLAPKRTDSNGEKIKTLNGSLESIDEKILRHQKEVGKTRIKVEYVNSLTDIFSAMRREIILQCRHNNQFFNVPTTRSNKNRSLRHIIKLIEFIQYLFLEIKKCQTENRQQYNHLIMAEKMCLGILGQLYKDITKKGLPEYDQNIIHQSILSSDVFETILVRHKQISHNVNSCDIELLHEVVEKSVTPWLQDFKHMLHLSLMEQNPSINEISESTPLDARLVQNFENFDPESQHLFIIYTRMVALNRFLKSQEVLDTYFPIKDIPDSVESELAAEIHFQASLAYRNLGDFSNCIPVLKKVITAAKRISDHSLKCYKMYGAYCDIAIAYIELDEYDKARSYLLAVTTETESIFPHQKIGANILLAGIESICGNRIVAGAQYELTFIKYFDDHYSFSKSHALSLVCHLGSHYLDEYNLKAAQDCLDFAEKMLERDFHAYIPLSGQQAIYYRIMIQYSLARFKVLKAIIQPDEQQRPRLEDLQKELLEYQEHEKPLTYFDNKRNIQPLLSTFLLGIGDPNTCQYVNIADIRLGDIDETIILTKVKESVMQIKKEVLDFYCFTVQHDTLSKKYQFATQHHEKKLTKMTDSLIVLLECLSIHKFQLTEYAAAKKYIQHSILFYSIVGYIESTFTGDLQVKATRCVDLGIDDDQLHVFFQEWIESDINIDLLREFICRSLLGENTSYGYVAQIAPSVIEHYLSSKDDIQLRDKQIGHYERLFMSAQLIETGQADIFIKNDERNQRTIIRYWDDSNGVPIIRERIIPNQTSANSNETNTRHEPNNSKKPSTPSFSKSTDGLFQGMFARGNNHPKKSHKSSPQNKQSIPKKSTMPPTKSKPTPFSKKTDNLFRGMFQSEGTTKNSSENQQVNNTAAPINTPHLHVSTIKEIHPALQREFETFQNSRGFFDHQEKLEIYSDLDDNFSDDNTDFSDESESESDSYSSP